MTAFNVTFTYLGNDWFLCAKTWTVQPARASAYPTEEAAGVALRRARRYMRNKQPKAHIVPAMSLEGAHPLARKC